MKYFKNDTASFYYNETVFASIKNICILIKDYPLVLEPFRGMNEKAQVMFSSESFQLYPTVSKTTLFYDSKTDCFFKILHPLTLKNSIFFFLIDRSRHIYSLSEYLRLKGIKVPVIEAYGKIGKEKKPFFVMKRVEGKSLYEILIRERKTLPLEIYLKVMDEVSKFHNLGYWFGDAHLSHIFVNDKEVSGFIDIDSIRKNKHFRAKNLAKDLAGLNYPELPVDKDDKMALFDYYMNKLNIEKKERFLRILKYYTERRWRTVSREK
ncbi:MAG: hypothetical protein A2Y97_10315 [Nitrospirae bacterium RBG_13_39_12]|nr:MAG: hypothetical protein A2Y97_10315 [Nitrospirae bacterium RBG_13_39_12]